MNMDIKEAFKTLGFGARFDLKRFKEDAERLKMIKHETVLKDAPKSVAQVSVKTQKRKAKKRRKISKLTEEKGKEYIDAFDAEAEEDINDGVPKKRKKSDKVDVNSNLQASSTKKSHNEHILSVRRTNKIYVWGTDVVDPCINFKKMTKHLSPELRNNVEKLSFAKPTSIQMQAIPLMLKRREILACAPTGSGKTLAFVIPMLAHLNKPDSKGFRAVVLEPTRELAIQTYNVIVRLSENTGLKVHMIKNVRNAAKRFAAKSKKRYDILVSTPRRVVSLLKHETCHLELSNVEWLVVDESDKLFESGKGGFREQLGAIYQACDNVNLRRAFFSATFSYEVEEWCKLNLDNVVMVCVGARNSPVETVQQTLTFVGDEHGKLVALRNLIRHGLTPPVLIFVQSRDRAEQLYREMMVDDVKVDVIHADRSQEERNEIVKNFRAGKFFVLICTELLGRGIDFKNVNVVVNYDFPLTPISYIHRIGRTGRAGRPGRAITFFTESDKVLLRSIANVMRMAGCDVPDYMLALHKTSRSIKKKIAKKAIGRAPITDMHVKLHKKKRKFFGHKKKHSANNKEESEKKQ